MVVITISSALIIFGIMNIYKKYYLYRYSKYVQKQDGLEYSLQTFGTEVEKGNSIAEGNPYELFLSVNSGSDCSGSVEVREIQLVPENGNSMTISSKDKTAQKFSRESTGECVVYFSFNNVNLKYVNYQVNLEVKLNRGNDKTSVRLNMDLKTSYKEIYRNTILDMIMSA